jgi:DNA-binding transcriptional MerR regulator
MNKPESQLPSIGEAAAAAALGVAVATLRRWHREGRLLPAIRTLGGHRRYAPDAVRTVAGV